MVFTLINIIVNTDNSIEFALKESLKHMKNFFLSNKLCTKKDLEMFLKIIEHAIGLSKESMNDIDAIKLIGEGWVAEEALAIALYASLKYSDDFKTAIVCAVNHDGESDSTGAITGNIIGAFLGYNKTPDYYVNNLELKDVILEIADDLSIQVSEYNKNNMSIG